MAFSHDELLLCTLGGRDDGKLIVWDMSNGYIVTVVANPNCASIVCWGGFVRTSRRDTDKYLFATRRHKGDDVVPRSLRGSLESERITTEGATVRSITTMVFSEDYTTIYCGTTSGDFTTINVTAEQDGLQAYLRERRRCRSFVNDAERRRGHGRRRRHCTGSVRLEELAKLKLPAGVVALSFAPDGSKSSLLLGMVPSIDYEGSLTSFTGVREPRAPVRGCSYARESSDRFATASTDKTLRVWDANDYKASATVLVRDAASLTCVYFDS